MTPLAGLNKTVDWVLKGKLSDCTEDEVTTRRTMVTAWIGVSAITPIWGVIYLAYGEIAAGLIPGPYGILSFVSIEVYRRIGGFEWIRILQTVQHLLLPFLLMWTLGGFGPSSAVLIWAFLAPLGSLWSGRPREAEIVTGSYVVLYDL